MEPTLAATTVSDHQCFPLCWVLQPPPAFGHGRAGPQVMLFSAGSPGAAGDGQSRKAGVPGGERGSPALLRRVVLQYYPPLPPVKLRGGTL